MLNTLFDTTNFSTFVGLKTNGNASILGNELRLTGDLGSQSGSAFYGNAIVLAPNTSFATQFQFNIGNGQGTGGADGMTFMLQNSAAGSSAIGRLGGDLGYAGILGNSIAIEFDTYDNGANDINDNHLSILRNGDVNTAIVTQTSPIDLNRNLPINAWVEYNGVTDLLEVFLSGTTIKPTAALLSTPIDLATALNGSAYFGFSGGTGGLWNTHTVQRWAVATETTTVPSPPPPPPIPAGTGNGLKAEYYDNADFTNLKLTRIDPSVNFNWGSGSPDVAIAPDTFSARWSGQVLAQYSETYTFYTTGDDGIRLTVNGQPIINGWKDQAPTEYSGTITLVAGQKYNIQLEYFETGGGAVSQLAWSSTSQAKQIIPPAQLFSTLPTPPPPSPPSTPPASGTGNGLKAEYYDNADFTNLKLTRIDSSVNFNWGSGSPDATIAADTFSARWSGQVLAQYSETYTFYTTGDDGIRLTVNGQQLINGWKDQGPTEYSGTITLVAGQKYNIQLEYYENGGGAVSQLAWSSTSQAKQIIPQAQLFSTLPTPPPPTPPSPPPAAPPIGNGHGLQAEYFDNADFTNRKVTRIDAAVNFDWGNGSPDAAIAADTFSARWSGQVLAQYSETYTFYTTGDDGIRLWVNGQQLINGWKDQAPTEYSGSIQLVAGQKYDIQLEYFENGGGAVAKLAWSSASQARQIIPKAQLFSKFNYGEALQKSIYFYDAQRSGDLPANNRVAWRGDSALNDGSTVGKDLTGGFYDAGDRLKFSRTIGYTAAMLSWGYLITPTAYSNSGQLPYLLNNIKWGTDYLLKAFTNDQAGQYEFYTQVGSMGSGPRDDHSNWVIAEVIDQVTDRPAYKINTATPGSDIAGQAAAALASASIVFRQQGNISYADLLLSKSEKLFDFADTDRGMGRIIAPNGVAQTIVGYEDTSYYDELVWSATWLHKAELAKNTGYGDRYLSRAEVIWGDPNASAIRGNYAGEQSWQTVDKGAELLLTQLTNKVVYRQEVESYLDWWTIGYNGTRVNYTPDGLAWQYQWGSLRHATTQGFMAIAYSDITPDATRQSRYQSFAANQVNYALGENPYGRSYMLGFGANPMRAVHHSTAYAPTAGWANFNATSPLYQPYPTHILYGGLLGGPGQQDQFTEDVANYVTNEVAIDYNAGLTGVLARLYATKGGTPLTNFPV